MTELEELEALRKEQGAIPGYGSELEELEALRKEQGSIKVPFEQQAAAKAWETIATPFATVGEYIDRITGAPVRAGIQSAQQGGSMSEALSAAGKQFGEPTSKAPTTAQLFENMGVSGEQSLPFAKVENFGTPYARFRQSTISPSEVAGGVTGMVFDPLNYVNPGLKFASKYPNLLGRVAKSIPKTPVELAAKSAGTTGGVGEWITKKGSRVAFGTGEPDFEYYKANRARLDDPARVRESLPEIRKDMLTTLEELREPYENVKKQIPLLDEELKIEGQRLKKDFDSREVVGPAEAETVHRGLELDKVEQGRLSEEADEALAKSNIVSPKKELKQIIQEEINKHVPNTPEKQDLINYLTSIKNSVDKNYSKYMSGQHLREWMQDVRKSIDQFESQRNKGEYVGEKDKSLLAIQRKVSDALKKESDEYASKMEEMHQRNLKSDLVKPGFTGIDERRGMTTIRRLLSKNSGDIELVDKQLRDWAINNKHPEVEQMLDRISEIRTARDTLENYNYDIKKMQDLADKNPGLTMFDMLQNLSKARESLQIQLEQAADKLGEFVTINAGQVEKFAENLGGPKPSLFNLEQMEAFEKATGKPFGQRIRDEAFEQRLAKDRPSQSSRLTNLGMGTVGGLVGTITKDPALTAMAIAGGATLGATADKFGGKIARALWKKSLPATEGLKMLEQKMMNPSPKLKTYLDKINQAGAIGSKGMLLYHHLLLNNDPLYRDAVTE